MVISTISRKDAANAIFKELRSDVMQSMSMGEITLNLFHLHAFLLTNYLIFSKI